MLTSKCCCINRIPKLWFHTENSWSVVPFFCDEFREVNKTFHHLSYPREVNKAFDLLNVVVPYLGEPNSKSRSDVREGLEKVRHFGTGLIANIKVACNLLCQYKDG